MLVKEITCKTINMEEISVGDILKVDNDFYMITYYYYKKAGNHYTAYGYVNLKTGENKGGYDTIEELLAYFNYPVLYLSNDCEIKLTTQTLYR